MTEPKRATWAEFVRWFLTHYCVAEEEDRLPSADFVRSRRDAMVCLLSLGLTSADAFDGLVSRWLLSLQSHGVSTPADPPSVADVLESAAGEISDAGKTFCSDLSGEEARRLMLAFGCAVAIVRAKAKEFS